MSYDASEAFIRTFSIRHRPAWDYPPKGFKNRDTILWRYRRRLSVTTRPILVCGNKDDDPVFFEPVHLDRDFHTCWQAQKKDIYPRNFFIIRNETIGSVKRERGHEFARKLVNQLREKGLEARNEIQMTELGASAEFVDIDGLAWKTNGDIKLIECKRLQLARTVAEVAEICRRFRDEAKDELDKHVQRVNWIKANLEGLKRIVGFKPELARMDYGLVINTHVPMMYLETLPIDANKIGSLRY